MFTVQDDVSTQRMCASNGAAKIDSADGPAIQKGLKDYGIVNNTSDIIKVIYSISLREEIVQSKPEGSGAGPTDEMEF